MRNVLCSLFLLCPFVLGAEGGNELLVHAHAHNDYEHERPLMDALDNGFCSVEADVWFVDGEILVSHNPENYKGTLEDLYLKPLEARVREKGGSVHGDDRPFYLWVDIKDKSNEFRPALHALLKKYSGILSKFTENDETTGPVTAVLTGDANSKEAFVDEFAERWACRDSNHYSPDDSKADTKWRWYALRWWNYLDWDGEDDISKEQRETLASIVDDIHAKGKKVRFYATPETEEYWGLAVEVGVDHVNTDELEELSGFLQRRAK